MNSTTSETEIETIARLKEEVARLKAELEPRQYTAVFVLLIKWATEDLGVDRELEDLAKVLSRDYGYYVTNVSIPDKNSGRELMREIGEWMRWDRSPDILRIGVYAGHGYTSSIKNNWDPKDLMWLPARDAGPKTPSVASTDVQEAFENSACDSLLIYDCCKAALTTNHPNGTIMQNGSVTEFIGASGFHDIAALPGPDSFSRALTETLSRKVNTQFSVKELYAWVLADLRTKGLKGGDVSTPTHVTLTSDGGRQIFIPTLLP